MATSSSGPTAVSLGANGWQMFWRVTWPNIRWGVLYGVILCNARAMGEFGAVYVVSGHIAGRTDTMPLRVEKLFQEYNRCRRPRPAACAGGRRFPQRRAESRTLQ